MLKRILLILALAVFLGAEKGSTADNDLIDSRYNGQDSSSRSLRNARELARVDYLLAADQNTFNGFNKSSNLAEIRTEIDRMRRAWMEKEMMAAENDAKRAETAERHRTYWNRVEANRAEREDAPLAVNIVHGLLMIYSNKRKAGL